MFDNRNRGGTSGGGAQRPIYMNAPMQDPEAAYRVYPPYQQTQQYPTQQPPDYATVVNEEQRKLTADKAWNYDSKICFSVRVVIFLKDQFGYF